MKVVQGVFLGIAVAAEDEPNTGGHCIWRKGVANPRRLIARVENEILHFMGRVRVVERKGR